MPKRSLILSLNQIATIVSDHYQTNDPNTNGPFTFSMNRMGRDSPNYALHFEGDDVVDNQDEWRSVMLKRNLQGLKFLGLGVLFIGGVMSLLFLLLLAQAKYPEYFTWFGG